MMTNREAAEQTIGELVRMGRLEAVDAARVQAVRSLADAVDSGEATAAMWRQYLLALADLSRLSDDGGSADAFLEALRGAAPLGD